MSTRLAALVLLLSAVVISACSTTEQAVSPTSVAAPTSAAAPTSVAPASVAQRPPEALASADEQRPATVEIPELAPYGPGELHGLDWLADQAALAALTSTATEQSNTGLMIDLSGLAVLSDRVALGLAELELAFTRSDTPDSTGEYGTSIIVHDNPAAALSRWALWVATSNDETVAVWQQTRAALANRVDIELVRDVRDLSGSSGWFVATSADPSLLANELIAAPNNVIAWSNREAQQYVPDAVAFDDGDITITASSRTTPPSIDELPYNSGMVIANELVGWATISTSISLPEAAGLWPAIWLLGQEACDAPGRCLGYQTDTYYEIDLLEARSQIPNEAHHSLHWYDEQIRSSSTAAPIDELTLDLEFERRPGLLIWRLDGEVVNVHTGRVDTLATGAHRDEPMMLIVNTAVGGSFAGDREIGRTGAWLGEALVPKAYPGTLRSDFVVSNIQVAAW